MQTSTSYHWIVRRLLEPELRIDKGELPSTSAEVEELANWLTFHRFVGPLFDSLPQRHPLTRSLVRERMRLSLDYRAKGEVLERLGSAASSPKFIFYRYFFYGRTRRRHGIGDFSQC